MLVPGSKFKISDDLEGFSLLNEPKAVESKEIYLKSSSTSLTYGSYTLNRLTDLLKSNVNWTVCRVSTKVGDKSFVMKF